MRLTKRLFVIIAFVLPPFLAEAQKKVDVTYERIKTQCQDVPLNQRIRITVARFSVSTPHTGGEFGRNMSTMLTNALQEVNCFRVIGSLADNGDLEDEIDFGEGKYSNKRSAPKKGKMLGAQLIVTGEITGYNLNTSNHYYGPVSTSSQTLNLSFIIQLRNPETRDILFSKKFNVSGKSGGGVGVNYGWYSYGGGGASNGAEADALGKGIIEAVDYIASEKDQLSREITGGSVTEAGYTATTIAITNADYETLTEFGNILKGVARVKNTDPSLEEGIASFAVQHDGTTRQLLEDIKKKAGVKYKVTGLKEGEINIMVR